MNLQYLRIFSGGGSWCWGRLEFRRSLESGPYFFLVRERSLGSFSGQPLVIETIVGGGGEGGDCDFVGFFLRYCGVWQHPMLPPNVKVPHLKHSNQKRSLHLMLNKHENVIKINARGHFRVDYCLGFKTSLRAKPVMI